MEHNYCEHHKVLGKELEEYMDCFSDSPNIETLCIVEKLAKTMVKLYELEAYEIMFDCLEDCFGYDRDEHEFEDKNGGGMDYVMFSIYNAYNPARMTRGTPHYPTTTGREYGTGADRRYGERYNERSTDKSMYQPYGMDYGMGYGWMNAYDSDRNRMMDDRRTGERNGERNVDRNGNRDRDMDSRGGERGMERGRYVMNKADVEKAKSMKPLDERTLDEWMEELVDDKGHEGPMFSKEESNALAKKVGVTFSRGYNQNEFWATLNMIYSDTNTALDANGQTARPETYARLAKNWLEDVDSSIDGSKKLAVYYHEIVDADEN